MSLPDQLIPVFQQIESLDALDQYKVAQTLGEYHLQHETLPHAVEEVMIAERFVWTLATDTHGEKGCWGAYFRPQFMSYRKDGGFTSHAIESILPSTISYWTARASEAIHPVLRARYADAAWELAPLVDAKRDISNARVAIDAYVGATIASSTMIPPINDLQRALNLALAINDPGASTRSLRRCSH